MAELHLVVNAKRYGGWKSLRVVQSIESLAGSFAFDVSDRWGARGEPWPIREEDACRVELDDEVIIDGYVDKRTQAGSAKMRTLSYTGRDRSAALVDNSLVLSRWTFRNLTLHEFASEIAKPWGIKVSVQAGLVLKKRAKIVVQPGDKGYDTLAREAKEDGVMLVSDGVGGVIITRASKERASTLVEGQNLLAASADHDGTDRYYRYVVVTQNSATDEASGNATRVRAEYLDDGVRRKDRVLLIRPGKGYSPADAEQRAGWDARVRAARAEPLSATVQGWRQPTGLRWRPNMITRVKAPQLAGVDGDMQITQVEYSIDDQGGEITQLRLLRPDAFAPEPKAAKVKAPNWWR